MSGMRRKTISPNLWPSLCAPWRMTVLSSLVNKQINVID